MNSFYINTLFINTQRKSDSNYHNLIILKGNLFKKYIIYSIYVQVHKEGVEYYILNKKRIGKYIIINIIVVITMKWSS